MINSIRDKSEMSDSELEFLCGLIRDNKPKKIVEVGVSAGGTTAVILHCLNELDYQCEMYSVDLSEKYYVDTTKNVGYIAEDYKLATNYKGKHNLLLGKVLPERLDQIGEGIDTNKNYCGLPVYSINKLPAEFSDCVIFKAPSSNIIDKTLKSLNYKSVVLPNNVLMSINSYIKSI